MLKTLDRYQKCSYGSVEVNKPSKELEVLIYQLYTFRMFWIRGRDACTLTEFLALFHFGFNSVDDEVTERLPGVLKAEREIRGPTTDSEVMSYEQ